MKPEEDNTGLNAKGQEDSLGSLAFNSMYGLLQGGMWLLGDLENFLMPLGLSQGRLAILLQVSASPEGHVNPADLARITGKSRPTITGMIRRLESDGLLLVREDGVDSRRKVLEVSSRGRDVLNEVVPGYNRRLRQIGRSLSDGDRRRLLEILGKLDFLDPEKKIGPVM